MEAMHYLNPSPDLLVSSSRTEGDLYHNGGGDGAREGLQYSLEKNFGELEFDWEQRTVTMRSMGEQPGDAPLLQASWTMDQLAGNEAIPGSLLTSQDFVDVAKSNPLRFERGTGEWVCASHRGSSNFAWQTIGHATATIVKGFASPWIMAGCILVMSVLRKRHGSAKATCSHPI